MLVCLRSALLLSLFCLLAWPAAANDDTELLNAVHAFLHQQAQPLGDELIISVRPPSARLPACEAPEPFLARPDAAPLGRVSVGVRCGESGRQVRYLQAEIGVIGDYPVLAVALAAGDTITSEHLTLQSGNLAELPNRTLLDIDAIIGQAATRALNPGQPLQQHQLRSIPLVERNQRVTVEARGAAFRISREGQALEPGGLGERIRIRFDNREVITAEVVGEGLLVVDF